jgi:kynurenine 3-monooxygenase
MERMVVVGGGLVGTLLSVVLAKRGYAVDVYDLRPDPRRAHLVSTRSINLTLCDRGFKALDWAGVGEAVRAVCVPAYGRMIHDVQGRRTFQPYGNRREAIYSVSRNDLNRTLLDFAERQHGINFNFNQKCLGLDPSTAAAQFRHAETGEVTEVRARVIFGADGAHSAVRYRLQRTDRFNYSQEYWRQGYKELLVRASAGGWAAEKNVLHIWPRGHFMLIGFPNLDGSLTCSLHIPFEGEPSYASLRSEADLLRFFGESFPDALPLMPNLVEDFLTHPPTSMVTIKCSPWSFEDKVLLVGDAAHAIFPSYGQGANAGFEDCQTLHRCMEEHGDDWRAVFADYEARRKPNTDAIADLCVEHFSELRDLVGSPSFLLRKEIERRINQLYPESFKDLYSMITFTCLPYTEALRIDREQRVITDRLMGVPGVEGKLNSPELTGLIHELMGARLNGARPANQTTLAL